MISLMPNGDTQSFLYSPSSLLTSILRKNAAASSPIVWSAVIRLIHGVGLFVIVAGADLREVAGFVTIAKRDEADLAVALEALRTVDHLASGLLQHL